MTEDKTCANDKDCPQSYYCSSKKICIKYHHEYCDQGGCGVGDGDCDYSNKNACAIGLQCGVNNCKYFHPDLKKVGMTPDSDCCEKAPKCNTDKDCKEKGWFCSSMKKCVRAHFEHCKAKGCGLGDGECDETDKGAGGSACAEGLTCGKNNCKKFHPDLAAAGMTEKSRCCEKTEKAQCQKDSDCAKLAKNIYEYYFCTSKKTCEKYDSEYCDKNVCGLGDGDCDLDSKKPCGPGLRCGVDNCKQFGHGSANLMGMFGGFPANADCCEPIHCTQSLELVGSNPSACSDALSKISDKYKKSPVQVCSEGELICTAGTAMVTVELGTSSVKCKIRTSGCAKDCSAPFAIPGVTKFENYQCKW